MAWLYLIVAGVFEIGFTTCLKMSDGFSKLWPSVGFFVCSILSFAFLTMAMKTIPLGTSYAVWTGIGAFGTAIVGIAVFSDPVGFWRIFLLACILGSVVGLKLVTPS